MKFDDALRETRTLTDLRRTAGAHVVDHRQLPDEELRDSVIKVKLQYLHEETVKSNLERALFRDQRNDLRIMSHVIWSTFYWTNMISYYLYRRLKSKSLRSNSLLLTVQMKPNFWIWPAAIKTRTGIAISTFTSSFFA